MKTSASIRRAVPRPLALGLALSLAASAVSASTVLDLTDTVTFNGTSYGVTPTGSPGTVITGANSLSLGDAFNNGTNLSTGANFDGTAGSGSTWNFQDDYVFTLTGTTSLAIAAIAFGSSVADGSGAGSYTGLTDLQARLIGASGNPAPTVGAPVGGTLVDSWTTFPAAGVDEAVTMPAAFAPGTYVLQIRGEAASPASYGGTITFAPVPLPPAMLLLLSGFAAFVVLAARRRGLVARSGL